MTTRIIILSLVVGVVVALSCGDSPTRSGGSIDRYEDFVWFDTNAYVLMWSRTSAGSSYVEPFLWWEASTAEPFTDVNGNGVYDQGIDIFIKCVCDSNQDLNHNGVHDEAAPFCEDGGVPDDINGDGKCQGIFRPHSRYEAGLPFADLNENGVYDSVLAYGGTVVRARRTSGPLHRYVGEGSVFTFTSDAGVTYFLPHLRGWATDLTFVFFLRDYGLVVVDMYGEFTIHVLDSGWIMPGNREIKALIAPGTPGYGKVVQTVHRSVRSGQSLQLGHVRYDDLLLVRIDVPWLDDGYGNMIPTDYFLEFYFSKRRGLEAVRYEMRVQDGVFFFDRQLDSIPVPMIR